MNVPSRLLCRPSHAQLQGKACRAHFFAPHKQVCLHTCYAHVRALAVECVCTLAIHTCVLVQSSALTMLLQSKGLNANTCVGMRHRHPYAEDAKNVSQHVPCRQTR